jgi:hypothetical protein
MKPFIQVTTESSAFDGSDKFTKRIFIRITDITTIEDASYGCLITLENKRCVKTDILLDTVVEMLS